MTAAAVNYQSQTTSNISNISQRAAVAALTGDLSAVAEMRVAFDRRRRAMTRLLNEIDGVGCAEPEGAFYCFPNVTGLLGRPLKGRVRSTSAELAETLLDLIKVAVVPGEAFGAPGYFRLSYALGDDDLAEGLGRLVGPRRGGLSAARLSLRSEEKGGDVARVLVTEQIAEAGLAELRRAGHEVDVRLGLSPAELREALRGAHALIIRSATQVDAAALDAGDRARRGRAARASAWTTSTSCARPSAASWSSTLPSRTSSRRPSRRWRCCWPRRATSPRPTPRSPRASGSAAGGRASSCTARPSASSAWARSARSSPSGRWPSG